jgi:hypothetical protein
VPQFSSPVLTLVRRGTDKFAHVNMPGNRITVFIAAPRPATHQQFNPHWDVVGHATESAGPFIALSFLGPPFMAG